MAVICNTQTTVTPNKNNEEEAKWRSGRVGFKLVVLLTFWKMQVSVVFAEVLSVSKDVIYLVLQLYLKMLGFFNPLI